MQIRLAEKIRALRRQHRFTQEQLAESLGVTPGAVYKWEAGLSQPELAIIVELADLFDTSVDVLLGYEVKDNRRQTTAERLRRYRTEKDRAGLAEAEKALQKYPNDFEIVYRSAGLYRVFGIVEGDEALLRRALTLLDKARLLLPQNTDPQINETVLYAETAQTLLSLGEADKAVSLWKTHNAGGFYSHIIGDAFEQLRPAAGCAAVSVRRPAERVRKSCQHRGGLSQRLLQAAGLRGNKSHHSMGAGHVRRAEGRRQTVLSGQGECVDAGVSGRCAEKQRGAGRSRRFSAAGADACRAV